MGKQLWRIIASEKGWRALADPKKGLNSTSTMYSLGAPRRDISGRYAIGAHWSLGDRRRIKDHFAKYFASGDLVFTESLPEDWEVLKEPEELNPIEEERDRDSD